MIVLARNRRGIRSVAQAGPARRALPEPPEGFELIMRYPPRQFAEHTGALRRPDRTEVTELLLAAAAARRPEQEVAAIIDVLRAQSRHSDAGQMIAEAARRPPGEVVAVIEALRQTGTPQDTGRVIAVVGSGPAGDIGALAEALRRAGLHDDVSHLLDTAITLHHAPQEVIALVGMLWSAGLGDEINKMLGVAAGLLTDVEIMTLAEALLAAGREEAASMLCMEAVDAVAQLPAEGIASLLHAMRDSGRHNDAEKLLGHVSATRYAPDKAMSLASALWSAGMSDDVGRILGASAARMADTEVVALAQALRDAGHDDAALQLCTEASAHHPVSSTLLFVRVLRDAGRPVDANRLLGGSGHWSAPKCVDLIAALRHDGCGADADRVLAASVQRSAVEVCDLAIALQSHGLDADAERLLAIGAGREPKDVYELVTALRQRRRGNAADRLLGLAAQRRTDDACSLVVALQRDGHSADADRVLAAARRRSGADLCDFVISLQGRGLKADAERLLASVGAERSGTAVANLADALLRNGTTDVTPLLLPLMHKSPQDVIAAGKFLKGGISRVNSTRLLAAVAERSGDDLLIIIKMLEESDTGQLDKLFHVVTGLRSLEQNIALAQAIRRSGSNDTANRLLCFAVSQRSVQNMLDDLAALCEAGQHRDADRLLEIAAGYRPVQDVLAMVRGWSGTVPDRRRILAAFAAARPAADVTVLAEALCAVDHQPQAGRLLKYAGRVSRGATPRVRRHSCTAR